MTSKFATNCVVCGCFLSGGTDTFGTIEEPICLNDRFIVMDDENWLKTLEDIEEELENAEHDYAMTGCRTCINFDKDIIALRKHLAGRRSAVMAVAI